ncbi:hypothetical protein Glove_553g38 [Diversispora epigaea]|uniref:TLDc domain-containing protein n=1 Tax=Diversispora epigaea TaxID=1348612 RepID=A0A397GDU8_9GLOM|nr:hypothetical protein Glove_553g38 [Diversispora epigaea]
MIFLKKNVVAGDHNNNYISTSRFKETDKGEESKQSSLEIILKSEVNCNYNNKAAPTPPEVTFWIDKDKGWIWKRCILEFMSSENNLTVVVKDKNTDEILGGYNPIGHGAIFYN